MLIPHSFFAPDGVTVDEACSRTTHLGVGAHPDDLEFMAFHGIAACFGRTDRAFGGVVCCDGAGSARVGEFADFSDREMVEIRSAEQKQAARIGRYSFVAELGHTSSAVRDAAGLAATEEIFQILEQCRPEVLYTHNPADKHAAHVAVFLRTLEAVRRLPEQHRPAEFYGCEVWRDLDWLPDSRKVLLDVSGHEELAGKLNAVFRSQIAGGKRYDLAVAGRRRANATFLDPRAADQATAVIHAIDLSPFLAAEDPLPVLDAIIGEFRQEVLTPFRPAGGIVPAGM